ncbi:hypothetical protein QUA42_02675 [Microcoleus sp. Pol11C2]|uniref:hypothetical protein n=1 Tax=Microcoleus sp. Pol11C2 TaxID=3055389 RepID=UPI002FD06E4C
MSRVSRTSGLSPSATRGSSAIDLGKDSGVDMGRKSQPSISSGGIGVTQEVGSIGGIGIELGAAVEVSPLGIDISGDPSKGTVGIAGSAELPGGLLGLSGGVKIDTNTGEIIGGSIGGEIGGLGINLSSDEGNIGVEFTLQIPFTPIELSLGLRFPETKKDQKPSVPTVNKGIGFSYSDLKLTLNPNCVYHFMLLLKGYKKEFYDLLDPNWLLEGRWREVTLVFGEGSTYIEKINPYNPVTKSYSITINANPPPDRISSQYWYWLNRPQYQREESLETRGNICTPAEFDYYMKNFYLRQWPEKAISIVAMPITCNGQPMPRDVPPVPETPVFAPFPNPPPRKIMDTCCQENLKFLRAIYTKLGLARFPGTLPETIIQEIPNEGEEPAEPQQVPIVDLVSLLDWQFRRDDERWGQWVIQIDVKDADVTQEGDQGKQVKFPNLAESIAEIEGQILSLTTNVDALVAITTKNLVESGLARQEAIKGYLASKSIIKYMAFKSTEIDVTVPSCFTPGAETIHELIAESEIHLKGMDYTEKETLRDIFLDLLQAAAVIRAVHWQRIDTKKDTKSQLLGILKGSLDLANSIKNPTKPTDGEQKQNPSQNFEDFLDSAESGFTNITGISDIQNPYGKTPDRRPRIRQIGDNISQAGGDN